MALGSAHKIIAFISLLVFILATYGSAFGSIGCHSAADGFQSIECNQGHPQVAIPHIDDGSENSCACDPLACHVLKSRSRIKRPIPLITELAPPFSFEMGSSPANIFSAWQSRSSLHPASQSLDALRTVVLLH